MLDLELIEDTIKELENEPTSFDTCEKLAYLYICKALNKNSNMSLLDGHRMTSHDTDSELNDILPAYQKYIDTKKRYQQFEVVDKMLIYAMHGLCNELVEFIADLYHNTETPAERALIIEMINNLRSAI